jgi:hypothetical protein
MTGFYDAGPLSQIAINLFYGWGYNFYRQENQLRADDLLIRAKVGALLQQARAAVEEAESAYRRQFIPPPSRANPYPDPQAVAGAQALEKLSHDIGALDGQIRALPVPENDRMTQRYRNEAQTLARLLQADELLTGQAELLRQTVQGKDGVWILANRAIFTEGLAAIAETVRARQNLLLA